jgi:hypothetical protein
MYPGMKLPVKNLYFFHVTNQEPRDDSMDRQARLLGAFRSSRLRGATGHPVLPAQTPGAKGKPTGQELVIFPIHMYNRIKSIVTTFISCYKIGDFLEIRCRYFYF